MGGTEWWGNTYNKSKKHPVIYCVFCWGLAPSWLTLKPQRCRTRVSTIDARALVELAGLHVDLALDADVLLLLDDALSGTIDARLELRLVAALIVAGLEGMRRHVRICVFPRVEVLTAQH